MRKTLGTVLAAVALTFGGVGIAQAAPVPAAVPAAQAATPATTNNDNTDRTGLWGLAGLIGLAGLAGLRRRDTTTVNRPNTTR